MSRITWSLMGAGLLVLVVYVQFFPRPAGSQTRDGDRDRQRSAELQAANNGNTLRSQSAAVPRTKVQANYPAQIPPPPNDGLEGVGDKVLEVEKNLLQSLKALQGAKEPSAPPKPETPRGSSPVPPPPPPPGEFDVPPPNAGVPPAPPAPIAPPLPPPNARNSGNPPAPTAPSPPPPVTTDSAPPPPFPPATEKRLDGPDTFSPPTPPAAKKPMRNAVVESPVPPPPAAEPDYPPRPTIGTKPKVPAPVAPIVPAPGPLSSDDPVGIVPAKGGTPPAPLTNTSPETKPITSPWTFHLEIVEGRNLITAKVGKTIQFRVSCDKVDMQSPNGTIQGTGNVKIHSLDLEASTDRMTINLQEDALLLEGKATLKCSRESQELELRSDRFSLRLSDIPGQTPRTSNLERPPSIRFSREQ